MKSTIASYVYVWICPVCGEKQYRDLDHNFGVDKCCGSTSYSVKPPREDLSGSALRTTRQARRKAKLPNR
jgi:hypothetical protein